MWFTCTEREMMAGTKERYSALERLASSLAALLKVFSWFQLQILTILPKICLGLSLININVWLTSNRVLKCHEILILVCFQKDPKKCWDITKLHCAYCSGCWLEQWVQTSFVMPQHCFWCLFVDKHWRSTVEGKIKVTLEISFEKC